MIKRTGKKNSLKQSKDSTDLVKQDDLVLYKIGETLRRYRNEKGLKLQDLADKINLSSSLLSKIENGRMIPTIPTLFSIINALQVEAQNFFSDLKDTGNFPGYIFIPKEKYTPYVKEENARGFNYFSIIERKIARGSFQITLLHLKPNAKRIAVSTAGFEFFYLISGSIHFELDKNIIVINEGDSLYFDGNIPHRPINKEKFTATLLIIYLYAESRD